MIRSAALGVGVSLALAVSLFGQALFVKPVKVFGDPNYIGTASNPTAADSSGPNVVEGREMQSPEGIALDTSVSPPILYVADTGNNRVLAYKYATELTPGSYADLILGQPDRFTTTAGGSGGGLSTGLRSPTGLAVDASGNLYVADTGNNRIVRYPAPFAQAPGYQTPDLVIGQTTFGATTANRGVAATAASLSFFTTSFAGRSGIAFDTKGNLWVADIGNNRVLRFPASVLKAGQFGPSADLAVGQPDLLTTTASISRLSKAGLSAPTGVAFDSAGRLLITDHWARVLVYAANVGLNASASRILGIDTTQLQTTPAPNAITINTSQSVAFAAGNVVVADNGYNRIMVFPPVDSWPAESTQFSPTATGVLGQTSFSTIQANAGAGIASAATLATPVDMAGTASELYVADTANNRVLVFPVAASGFALSATRVIGQLDFPYNAPNLVEGKEFNTAATAGLSGSAILDYSSNPPHMYVADAGNNRILGFNNFLALQNGQKADLVIGQPDLLHTSVNYPSLKASAPTAQGLNGPAFVAVDSAGNLWVADTLNGRVLRFPAPFASGVIAGESADLVIGQSDFTTQVTDVTQSNLTDPISLAFTPDGANTKLSTGYLAVADPIRNRVLFYQKPFSKGMSASIVLGQPNFTTGSASTGPSGMTSPQAVAIDPQDRVIVGDTGNGRLLVYPAVSSITTTSTPPSFAITSGLTQPVAISISSGGQFWVADPGTSSNRLVHFSSIDQLPVANPPYSADTTLTVASPRSAFVDQFNNLLVCDGLNRILYFVPRIVAQNAANYLDAGTRALAPGTFTTIYPALGSNSIAAGSAAPSSLPLPTTAADTQITVNGIAAALSYVSPGQINFPMPMALPTGGTVNLQVTRPSTGQIYGAAELQMASASPALFVIGAQQSGPVAALNQDNSVNTATNPIARGQVIQLFGTGQGPVANPPAEGQAPTGPLPTALNPQVLLGLAGSVVQVPAANIQYSGLAPSLVGLWQINILIPQTAPTGTVPISVIMNSIPSSPPVSQTQTTQIVTTIAIK